VDEFNSIARLFQPLAAGAPEALGLLDDAAVLPARPGYDLVVTKDALVEGVHFLSGDPPDLIARKLLRVNLSDLAAKGAEPYGYLLATAWPAAWDEGRRTLFAAGLARDQQEFGLKLFGGDTVSTPGPLTLCVTMFGWTPEGAMVKRSGAQAQDVVLVSGVIGEGHLGLAAATGRLTADDAAQVRFAGRYRVPEPRLSLRACLRQFATAAADVSDGLLADAAHIGAASELGVHIDLDRIPLSADARLWLEGQDDPLAALTALASGGDDYEVVFTVPQGHVSDAALSAAASGVPVTVVGRMTAQAGCRPFYHGRPHTVARLGWSHD